MPKLQNVTNDEIAELADAAELLSGKIHDAVQRMEKGYRTEVTRPLEKSASFMQIAGSAADLARLLLFVHRMQNKDEEIEALRKEIEGKGQ